MPLGPAPHTLLMIRVEFARKSAGVANASPALSSATDAWQPRQNGATTWV